MLSEVTRRRATFDPARSVPVRFGDGSEWFIPRPSVWVRPVFRDGRVLKIDGQYQRTVRIGYNDPDIDDLVEALAADGLDFDARASGVATLASMLLRRHYELSEVELNTLLSINPSNLESAGWMLTVVNAATTLDSEAAAEKGGEA